MQIIDTHALPQTLWKNGGGTTRTVAVSPEGAGLDDFIWRISIAEVHASGPFSAFPGVDRTLLLLSGEGMLLETVTLSELFRPHLFAGEASIYAKLLGGPIRDLNIMVRRGCAIATVQCWKSEAVLATQAGSTILFCAQGAYRVQNILLSEGQASRVDGLVDHATLVPETSGAVLIGVMIREDL